MTSTVSTNPSVTGVPQPSNNVAITGGTISGATITNSPISGSTVSGTTLTATTGASGLTVGSGGTTNAGWVLGYYGSTGLSAEWSTAVTPSSSNYALVASATTTGVNAVTTLQLSIGDTVKATLVAGSFSIAAALPLVWNADSSLSRISAGLIGVGTGAAASFAGSLKLTNLEAVGTLGVRALSTLTDGADGTNTSGYKFVSFVSNSAEAGNVIRVAQTAAVVFTTSSDGRLKNVGGPSDLTAAANRIMSYRMRDFEWKSQPGAVFSGPIAQEIYEVNKDPMLVVPGEGESSWSVNMSGFIPDLIMTAQRNEARLAKLEAAWQR